jgi:hypothetical protein
MATVPRTITGPAGDPLAEAIELTRRLKLPHIRRATADLVPTAKAQRWDPAEVIRVLLAEEAAGPTRRTYAADAKRAGFPAGKTSGDWDETASSIPRRTQDPLTGRTTSGRPRRPPPRRGARRSWSGSSRFPVSFATVACGLRGAEPSQLRSAPRA